MPASRLLLYCDYAQSRFILGKQNVDWRQHFPDMEEALAFAFDMVMEETPLTIFDELGNPTLNLVACPRA